MLNFLYVQSAAWRSGYLSWKIIFIIFAWWNMTSSKLAKSEATLKRKTLKQRQLLSN